ncbi:zinc transporter ZIP3 [Cylas formicarius]|uniref:zinc transporter ZIP3 n=1 Tax=Cylas formicarius TaxID=197179 RepID=UPI002958CF67|nr:zinc transporter ZIP3 [Cylas formicarius]
MNLAQSKVFAIVSLGVGSILSGLLPACFTNKSRKRYPLGLSCLLCFGGGVLLATSLIHILPEAREATRKNFKPYTELFFCGGFFLLYLMDETVHYFYGAEGHKHETHFEGGEIRRRHSASDKNSYGTAENGALLRYQRSPPYNPAFFRARSDSFLYQDNNATPSQLCHVGHQEPCPSSVPTANFGLLVALSVHSLLEGLVVGLEDLPSKVLLLLGAIASHKLVVGFCLGAELASGPQVTFCTHFVSVLVFAGASLAGIVLGMVISEVPRNITSAVIPILQALAGGTLLYVTVSEVLPRERARWHQQHGKRAAGVVQLAAATAGFCLMTVFSRYLGE